MNPVWPSYKILWKLSKKNDNHWPISFMNIGAKILNKMSSSESSESSTVIKENATFSCCTAAT